EQNEQNEQDEQYEQVEQDEQDEQVEQDEPTNLIPNESTSTPQSELNHNITTNNIISYNKNDIITCPYFIELINGVLNKYDAISNEENMKTFFSLSFKTMDIVIDMLKEQKSKLHKEYNNEREDILNTIHYKKDSIQDIKELTTNLIEKRQSYLYNLNILYKNKINTDNEVKKFEYQLKGILFQKKQPTYYLLVEQFFTKFLITLDKWKNFILKNRNEIPSKFVAMIEHV
ncbi:conserved protein, unknown function, partial [Hepatocystis sp. ex Piliocolobus tephrosceles]